MVQFANNVSIKSQSEDDDDAKSRGSKRSDDTRGSRSIKNRRGTIDSRYNDERLGEDFEETPWVPPNIGKALEFKEQAILRGGNAPLRTIKICQAPELGAGVSLYFQFVKSIAIGTFFMAIFSIPAIIFAYYGKGILDEDKDTFGFWKFTIGNIGYNPLSPTYMEDSICTTPQLAQTNSSCIHFLNKFELTSTDTAVILTFCEIIQYILFTITVLYLSRRTESLHKEMEKEDTTICDYSIMVRNLPPDCSYEQLLSHFSNLYGLNSPDWLNRPAVQGACPVRHCDHSHRAAHIGTWVAECTLYKKIGKFISAFLSKEHLTTQLFRTRARMKMYADDTPHSKGPNASKHATAERHMLKTAMKLDALTERILQAKNLSINQDTKKFGKSYETDLESGYKDYNTQIDAKVIAAFITFEYTESMARCIEDYSRYSTFPRSLFYPPQLKFRGTRIRVDHAPEPDDIVFENLEVPAWSKYLRRLRTTIAMIIALAISFIIILQASRYKQEFANSIPNLNYCADVLPQQYMIHTNVTDVQSVTLTRPTDYILKRYDSLCDTQIAGSFYAIYSIDGQFGNPVANYNLSHCNVGNTVNICPNYGDFTYCPCVSTTSTTDCNTYQCSTESTSSKSCHTYEAKLIGDCYCYEEFSRLLSEGLGVSFLSRYSVLSKTPQCKSFYIRYTTAEVLTYVATILVVLINFTLQYILYILNKAERHSSVSNEKGSYMFKLFIAQYINMAVVALVAFGKLVGLPDALHLIQIFQGTYTDFDSRWFGSVGSYLLFTFIISVGSNYVLPLLQYLIIYPLARYFTYPSIRNQSNTSIVMQEDLNKYEVGKEFETSNSSAQALTVIFFAMTYAPGIPLLMPAVFFSFLFIFNIDKYLICRFYQRPPKISQGVINRIIQFLPFATIIRLAFSIWMYSNTDFFPTVGPNTLADFILFQITLKNFQHQLTDIRHHLPSHYSWVQNRIFQPTIFPLVILLAFAVLIRILYLLWVYIIPLPVLIKFITFYWSKNVLGKNKHKDNPDVGSRRSSVNAFELMQMDDYLRQEAAPYSEQYYSYLVDKDEIPTNCCKVFRNKNDLFLSEQDVIDGWVHVDHDKYILKCKIWVNDATIGGGTLKRAGEFKRTYEVISDAGCCSYNLETIPHYRKAIIGLEQGAENMESDAILSVMDQYKNRHNGKLRIDWDGDNNKSPHTRKSSMNRKTTPSSTRGSKVVPGTGNDDEKDDDDDSGSDSSDDDNDDSDSDSDSDFSVHKSRNMKVNTNDPVLHHNTNTNAKASPLMGRSSTGTKTTQQYMNPVVNRPSALKTSINPYSNSNNNPPTSEISPRQTIKAPPTLPPVKASSTTTGATYKL